MPKTRPSLVAERTSAARSVGRLLAAARIRAGLTQTETARALDVPQSRIAKLEVGLRQLLFTEAVRLSELYGIDMAELNPNKPAFRKAPDV